MGPLPAQAQPRPPKPCGSHGATGSHPASVPRGAAGAAAPRPRGSAAAGGTRRCCAGSGWRLWGLTPPAQPRACWGHPAPGPLLAPHIISRSAPVGKSPSGSACTGVERRWRREGVQHPPHPPALRKAGLPPCCVPVPAMENPVVPCRSGCIPGLQLFHLPSPPAHTFPVALTHPAGVFQRGTAVFGTRSTQHRAEAQRARAAEPGGGGSGLIPVGFSCSAEPVQTPKEPPSPSVVPLSFSFPTPVRTGDAPSHPHRAGYLPHRAGPAASPPAAPRCLTRRAGEGFKRWGEAGAA